jgi:hypothetical protein
MRAPLLRLVALAIIFVAVSQGAVALVRASGGLVVNGETLRILLVVGGAGLIAMAGSIFIGVYLGAWVGIGAEARQQRSFIWWVINRLLFLAAVGSIQGFAQFFLRDVLQIPNAATMTTVLLAVVALFLMPSAIGGGYLADRIGRKRLVGLAGIVAALGTFILLFSTTITMVIISGSIIGLATGTFMATNWALGTDIVPKGTGWTLFGYLQPGRCRCRHCRRRNWRSNGRLLQRHSTWHGLPGHLFNLCGTFPVVHTHADTGESAGGHPELSTLSAEYIPFRKPPDRWASFRVCVKPACAAIFSQRLYRKGCGTHIFPRSASYSTITRRPPRTQKLLHPLEQRCLLCVGHKMQGVRY